MSAYPSKCPTPQETAGKLFRQDFVGKALDVVPRKL